MPIGDIYQLNVPGNVGKQYVENVMHYEITIADTPDAPNPTATDLIAQWVATVQPMYLACLPTDYVLGGYKCKRIKPTGSNTVAQIDGASVGTAGGASVTSGQAPLCIFPILTTTNPVRKYNTAKLFLPAMTVGTVIGDIIQPAFLVAMNAFITAFLANLALAGGGMATPSLYTKSSGAVSNLGIGSPSFILGTQRRRLKHAL